MKEISFSKLSGSGNDFILIDNRDGAIPGDELSQTARMLCRRKFSIGADGLIAIETSEEADFRWQFFNADGSAAEMCGNGGRCAARFAVERGVAASRLCFETLAGMIHAEVSGTRVKLELPPPGPFQSGREIVLASGLVRASLINTGVPHAVISVEDLDAANVQDLGRQIRFHSMFEPAGTNVDFIQRVQGDRISMRTYERGVEGETLACGTGAVASACTASHAWGLTSPVEVLTRGGEALKVYFSEGDGRYGDLFLEGETTWIYDATCTDEALK